MDHETEQLQQLYGGTEMIYEPVNFGMRLRQIRKELGETQDEFAARIGTSKQVLSRYESGQRIPKISLLEKYAQSLNVSVDYLMGGSEQENAFETVCTQGSKPFYKIFIDVTMGETDYLRIDNNKKYYVLCRIDNKLTEIVGND